MRLPLITLFILLSFSQKGEAQTTDSLLLEANSLKEKGIQKLKSNQKDSSLFYCRLAADAFACIGQDELYFYCLYKIEDVRYKINRTKNRLEVLRNLEKVHSYSSLVLGESNSVHGEIARLRGVIFYDQQDYLSAIKYQKKAIEIEKELPGESPPGIVFSLNNLGLANQTLTNYDLSIKYLLEALDLDNQQKPYDKDMVSAIIRSNLGNSYKLLGKHPLAIKYLNESLAIWDSVEVAENGQNYSSFEIGKLYSNMADVYIKQKRTSEALTYAQLSLGMKQRALGKGEIQAWDLKSLSRSYKSIGDAYYEAGQIDTSLYYYEKSLALVEKHSSDVRLLGNAIHDLGGVHLSLGNYDKAKMLYKKSIALRKQEQNPLASQYFTALDKMSLGLVYKNTEDYDSAINYLTEALNGFEKTLGAGHSTTVQTRYNLGATYFNDGDYHRALDNFSIGVEALLGARNSPTNNVKIEALKDVPALLFQLVCEKAIAQYHIYIGTNAAGALDSAYTMLSQADSMAQIVRGGYLDYPDLLRFNEAAHTLYTFGVSAAFELHENTNQNHFLEKGLEFAEKSKSTILLGTLIQRNSAALFPIPDSILNLKNNLELDISFYTRKLLYDDLGEIDNPSLIRMQDTLAKLTLQKRELINQIKQDYPQYYNLQYQIPIKGLRGLKRMLKHSPKVIAEYIIGEYDVYAILIAQDSSRFFKLGDKDSLYDLAQKYFNTVENLKNNILDNQDEYIETAYSLYHFLFEPLGIDTLAPVMIVPDVWLAYLPFESLIKTKQPALGLFYQQYLVKWHPISYAYSIATYLEMAKPQITPLFQNKVLAIAPSFTSQTPPTKALRGELQEISKPLLHNKEEGEHILRLYQGEMLNDHHATLEAVTKNLGNYQVLHFSTHGRANDEYPELSYIALSTPSWSDKPDKLYCFDVAKMDLNAEMVVLSACETGLGKLSKGEGLMSLAQSFSYAGANSLVNTLWSVEDGSTTEIMKSFYDYLAEGMPKDVSLQKAKIDFINNCTSQASAHPFHWAGAIAIGDMKPVQATRKKIYLTMLWITGVFFFSLVIFSRLKIKP